MGIVKKADLVLLALLLLFTGTGWGLLLHAKDGGADTVRVTVNGSLYGEYPLDENTEIDVMTDRQYLPVPDASDSEPAVNHNLVIIRDGSVFVAEADCKNQICVHTGAISAAGQTISCLPHRLVVTILSNREGYDAIAH